MVLTRAETNTAITRVIVEDFGAQLVKLMLGDCLDHVTQVTQGIFH